jgi:ADP-heptose:LPS heptosyltransferase
MDDAKRHSLEDAAGRLASEFLSEFQTSGHYLGEHIARLAELATSADERDAKQATVALFASVIEPLADSFDPAAVSLYNRAFAQLIQACRLAPRGELLDRRLHGFGLSTEADIVSRAEQLRPLRRLSGLASLVRDVERAVVLSRVTLGADVAITSVIIERIKRELPRAEIVLLGGRKAAQLFGGDRRLSFRALDYERAGTITSRLLSWLDLLDAMGDLTRGLERGQYLVLDPDSRLTQLGLLPITSDDYLFFPSREYGHNSARSLGELAALWLNEIFGPAEEIHPRVSLARSDLEAASTLMRQMRQGGARKVITINFGIGGNLAKRVDDELEKSLVARLIGEGATVILDKGAGEDESRRADAVIMYAMRVSSRGRAARMIEIDETNLADHLSSGHTSAELIVWRGRIGLLAAMIGESDLYIGYDSAGQHIAAALGVPCLDIFAGFSSPRMLDRWRPTGKAEARVIAVDTKGGCVDSRAVLADALRHARELTASTCR